MSSTRKRLVRAGVGGAVAIGTVALLAGTAFAQDEEEVVLTAGEEAAASVQAVLDNIWVLIAAVLVIFMQAGFALV
ncbi:MAG: ammonium transporter, partial [Acidimicrobiales bacterium]|nr:ammonium transporter [Acidimicrobiales bacterium]